MDQSENFWCNKHAPFLANPICMGQTQGGEETNIKKKEAKTDWGFSFGIAPPPTHTPWGHTIFCLPNKTLSCNRAVTLGHHFKSLLQQDRTEKNTIPRQVWCHILDVSWLKQSQLRLREAETKHSRGPTWQKLTWWKLNTKETQSSGSDKKPRVLVTGTTKQTWQKAHMTQYQIPEDLWLRWEVLTPMAGRIYG